MAAWVTWVAPHQGAVDLRESLPQIGGSLRLPWSELRIRRGGPWQPSEILERAAPVPLLDMWVLEARDPRGRLLNPRAHDALVHAPLGPVARGGQAWDTEIFAPAASKVLGAVVVLAHQDQPGLDYAAEYRDGRLVWSLAIRENQGKLRVFRSDGRGVSELRRRDVAEGERSAVLLRGLERLVRHRIEPADHEKFVIPELIAECMAACETL